MAITINWLTFVIYVPKADLTLIQAGPPEIYELDIDWFRLKLRDIEDNEEGVPFLKTHNHNTEVLLGGVTFARVVEILAPYTVTFQDGQYAVNLVGANSNIGDRVNVNQVSVRSYNSAGLTSSQSVWDELIANHLTVGTTGKALNDAGSAGNPWGTSVTGNTDPGTFGELVGKKLLTIAKFLGLK
jgi:hypothetical protein